MPVITSGLGGIPLEGAYDAAQVAASGGVTATIGSLAGALGVGFGAGSLAGGLVQNAVGKVGPAPQIGAGLGAAAGLGGALAIAGAAAAPWTFGLSALIGGPLGGAAGGLF